MVQHTPNLSFSLDDLIDKLCSIRYILLSLLPLFTCREGQTNLHEYSAEILKFTLQIFCDNLATSEPDILCCSYRYVIYHTILFYICFKNILILTLARCCPLHGFIGDTIVLVS